MFLKKDLQVLFIVTLLQRSFLFWFPALFSSIKSSFFVLLFIIISIIIITPFVFTKTLPFFYFLCLLCFSKFLSLCVVYFRNNNNININTIILWWVVIFLRVELLSLGGEKKCEKMMSEIIQQTQKTSYFRVNITFLKIFFHCSIFQRIIVRAPVIN